MNSYTKHRTAAIFVFIVACITTIIVLVVTQKDNHTTNHAVVVPAGSSFVFAQVSFGSSLSTRTQRAALIDAISANISSVVNETNSEYKISSIYTTIDTKKRRLKTRVMCNFTDVTACKKSVTAASVATLNDQSWAWDPNVISVVTRPLESSSVGAALKPHNKCSDLIVYEECAQNSTCAWSGVCREEQCMDITSPSKCESKENCEYVGTLAENSFYCKEKNQPIQCYFYMAQPLCNPGFGCEWHSVDDIVQYSISRSLGVCSQMATQLSCEPVDRCYYPTVDESYLCSRKCEVNTINTTVTGTSDTLSTTTTTTATTTETSDLLSTTTTTGSTTTETSDTLSTTTTTTATTTETSDLLSITTTTTVATTVGPTATETSDLPSTATTTVTTTTNTAGPTATTVATTAGPTTTETSDSPSTTDTPLGSGDPPPSTAATTVATTTETSDSPSTTDTTTAGPTTTTTETSDSPSTTATAGPTTTETSESPSTTDTPLGSGDPPPAACPSNAACFNGGVCFPIVFDPFYECVCADGFCGPQCEHSLCAPP